MKDGGTSCPRLSSSGTTSPIVSMEHGTYHRARLRQCQTDLQRCPSPGATAGARDPAQGSMSPFTGVRISRWTRASSWCGSIGPVKSCGNSGDVPYGRGGVTQRPGGPSFARGLFSHILAGQAQRRFLRRARFAHSETSTGAGPSLLSRSGKVLLCSLVRQVENTRCLLNERLTA